MKNLLTILLLAAVGFTACSTKRIPASGSTIPATELQALTAKGKVQLIDARTEGEYKEGHIPGAQLMDVLQEANFLQQIKTLDPKKTYVVYCRSGKRSKRAMELMLQNGFKNVSDLDGGIQGWTGPTEK
jgi:phage shock protein E